MFGDPKTTQYSAQEIQLSLILRSFLKKNKDQTLQISQLLSIINIQSLKLKTIKCF